MWTGTTAQLRERGQARAVRELLDSAFATDPDGAFTDEDWAHALGGWHALLLMHARPVAHASVVARTLTLPGRGRLPTGYVEAVATAPELQGRGLGSAVMAAVAGHVGDRYALGALSTGRPAFYARLGWRTWRGPTWVDGPTGPERTPDEDGGVMVLLTPGTADLDLDGDLRCDWRPGDLW